MSKIDTSVVTIDTTKVNNTTESVAQKDTIEKGNVVFYTNVHCHVNCLVNINIFVDSVSIGNLSVSYALGKIPDCGDEFTLNKNITDGIHSFYALPDCGKFCWRGTFYASKGTCTKVFLDFFNAQSLN